MAGVCVCSLGALVLLRRDGVGWGGGGQRSKWGSLSFRLRGELVYRAPQPYIPEKPHSLADANILKFRISDTGEKRIRLVLFLLLKLFPVKNKKEAENVTQSLSHSFGNTRKKGDTAVGLGRAGAGAVGL